MTFVAYPSQPDPPLAILPVVVGWTGERVERLKVLYAEGLSCSQIAAELLHISRNGVIGKVHRLGLERRGANSNRLVHGSKPGPKPRPRVANPLGRGATLPREKIRHESPEIKAMRCAEIVPLNVSLFDLAHGQCKFPYGDGPTFLFCGHEALNHSYCQAHRALAVKPTKGLSA